MPLSDNEIAELEALIRRRRDQLLAELREEAAQARGEQYEAVAGAVTDRGDESVADLLTDLDNAEMTRDVTELRSLEAALARIADGTYGRCVDCGLDIGLARLRAQPAALRCLPHQEAYEKTHAYPGAPKL